MLNIKVILLTIAVLPCFRNLQEMSVCILKLHELRLSIALLSQD